MWSYFDPQRKGSYFWGSGLWCKASSKLSENCDRKRGDRQTDRQTDAGDFIICPMLCYRNGTDKNIAIILCIGVARILCWGGVRDAEGVERGEKWGGEFPSPADYGIWGSVASSPSGAENGFWCILNLKKNECGDDKFDIFCHFYSAYLESNLHDYSFDIFFSFAGGLGPSPPPPPDLATAVILWLTTYTRIGWQTCTYCDYANKF